MAASGLSYIKCWYASQISSKWMLHSFECLEHQLHLSSICNQGISKRHINPLTCPAHQARQAS